MGRNMTALTDAMVTCSSQTNAAADPQSTECDLSDVEQNLDASADKDVTRDDDKSDTESTCSSDEKMTIASLQQSLADH